MNEKIKENSKKVNHRKKPKTATFNIVIFIVFFIVSLVYFFNFGNYVLLFQEKQQLFIFSTEYLQPFLLKPGGLIELAGKFFTQFYANKIIGSLILSTIIFLNGLLIFKISTPLLLNKNNALLISLIPVSLLLLMQTHYFHLMEYNIGFLLILIFFQLTTHSTNKRYRYFILLLLPVFYYLSGAFISIFLGLFILYNLIFEKEKLRFSYSIFALLLSILTFFIFHKILFGLAIEQLLLFPLPLINDSIHRTLFTMLSGCIILIPCFIYFSNQINIKKFKTNLVLQITACSVFAALLFSLKTLYNPQTNNIIQLEKLVFEENFEDAVAFQTKTPALNLIGEYFFNVALSESDQLCEKLFQGPQNFGAGSLILPWSNEYLSWGPYFYYSIGLINEAHRWAYEELVVYGKRPQNIILLVKTNLINENYKRAKKYNNILKKTIFYRKWAIEIEELLADTAQVNFHSEFRQKRKLLPNNIFFTEITNPQENIIKLLESNSKNKRAFEYKMAWLLLSKDVESIVNNLSELKTFGYNYIPRHLEEAVLIYYNGTKQMPDLGELSIRAETFNSFENYVTAYKNARNNSSVSKQKLKENFHQTFMYYFHFKNP